MLVKSSTWQTLPAAPWLSPGFRPSERVGQGAGPAGAAGVPVAGPGLLLAGACGDAVTVTVLVGAAPGVELPHAAASTATLASTAAMASRAGLRGAVIQGSLCLGGSTSRTDIYDVGWAAVVACRRRRQRHNLDTIGGPGPPARRSAAGPAGSP